jgi:hypothetical protein
LYFPTASCVSTAEFGTTYRELSAFYLINSKNKTAAPYFGLAFYNNDFKMKAKELADKVRTVLGKGYTVSKRNEKGFYISKAPLKKFDDEGDPRDLCQNPRPHEYVSYVQTRQGTQDADFILITHVKSTCEFGDRVARN